MAKLELDMKYTEKLMKLVKDVQKVRKIEYICIMKMIVCIVN